MRRLSLFEGTNSESFKAGESTRVWSRGVIGVMISGSSVGLGDGFLAGGVGYKGKPKFGGEHGLCVEEVAMTSEMVGEEKLYFGGKAKSGGLLRPFWVSIWIVAIVVYRGLKDKSRQVEDENAV